MASASSGGVPPGFRFHPTDEELLHYYLKKKVSFHKFDMEVIREVDLNKMEPWELQERCKIGSTPQNEWFFFSHKDRKYPTGSRTNRATNAGFWKATGRDKCIRNSFKKIGMRKTLVFYRGRAPHGQKTDWIMHEYRLEDGDDPQQNTSEDGWVVCRVFKKKNLFKVGGGGNNGNEASGGSSSINSDHQLRSSNFMHRISTDMNNNGQYLVRQPHSLGLMHQLNNKPNEHDDDDNELALHYAHRLPPPHQYTSLLHSQHTLPLPYHYTPPTESNLMAKQLMMSNTAAADCDTNCDATTGLDIGTTSCEPASEWTMLAQPQPHPHPHLGLNNEDHHHSSSNHLSLRGEMDFWGYTK
ncbi:hypothetical protein UlMin_043048 [Ulmus minor]